MPQDMPAIAEPTSTAATRETEPEVVAGISSAEGGPDLPTDIRAEGGGFSWARIALFLVGGAAVGYGATMWLRRRM